MFGPTLRSCSCRGHAQYPTFAPGASQVALVVKNPPANAGDIRDTVRSLGREDPLEEGLATQPSVLAWRIPCAEEPGGLQSIGSHRVGHD